MPTGRYDIIILGSGAGGGTLAHALAKIPVHEVSLETRRREIQRRREGQLDQLVALHSI